MKRCAHEPKQIYDKPETLGALLLLPHRARDWYRCEKCGLVGLAAKRSHNMHSWAERPELVERAEKWNAHWRAQNETVAPDL